MIVFNDEDWGIEKYSYHKAFLKSYRAEKLASGLDTKLF